MQRSGIPRSKWTSGTAPLPAMSVLMECTQRNLYIPDAEGILYNRCDVQKVSCLVIFILAQVLRLQRVIRARVVGDIVLVCNERWRLT